MSFLSGHGTALAFGTTTTFAPGYTSIGGFEATRETLDTTGLATTGARTKIGGDLFDVGAFTANFLWDADTVATGEANAIDDLLFDSGSVSAAETATVTQPNAGATTLAATADITGFALEDMTTDQLIAASITIQWQDWPTIAE